MWNQCMLVAVLVMCSQLPCCCCNNTDIFITPFINDSSCPSETCYTLSQFVDIYFSTEECTNITLFVLPGNHSLDSDLSLMDLVELTVINSHEAGESKIFCSLHAVLLIENVSMVHIGGVELFGCQIVTISSARFTYFWNVYINSSTTLLLNNKYVTIVNSTFSYGQGVNGSHGDTQGMMGGAVVVTNSTIWITNSVFENNRADFGGAIYMRESNATITDCLFQRNVANVFGGCVLALDTFILSQQCSYFGNSAIVGGVLIAYQSEVSFNDSHISNNMAVYSGGAIQVEQQSVVSIIDSNVEHNHANMLGGVLSGNLSAAVFIESTFSNNTSGISGGVIAQQGAVVSIVRCAFESNVARERGGVVAILASTLTVYSSTFSNNVADSNRQEYVEFGGRLIPVSLSFGGAILALQSNISLYEGNIFRNNKASRGGTIFLYGGIQGSTIPAGLCNAIIKRNMFINNNVEGGVLSSVGCYVSDFNSDFQDNKAYSKGSELLRSLSLANEAVIDTLYGIVSLNKSRFINNSMEIGATLLILSSTLKSFSILLRDNNGSIYVQDSNVTFSGDTTITNSTQLFGFDVGGGISAYQSTVQFHGTSKLIGNHAEYGGGIRATDSKVYFFRTAVIAGNSAGKAGGALFLTRSEVTCSGDCRIYGNTANKTGGGVHAVSSTITIKAVSLGLPDRISFIENTAEKGGGLYFQANSKLYIIIPALFPFQLSGLVTFVNNSAALYGGAMYVADDSYSDTCSAAAAECFFQLPNIGNELLTGIIGTTYYSYLEFSDNSADRGSVLYGGLLDRCTVSPYAFQLKFTAMDGLQYLASISGSEPVLGSVSSDPVRVCFCVDKELNCSYQHPPVRVRKGAQFTVTVAAVDHVSHSVSADIISSHSPEGGLGEGQQHQSIADHCTELAFNLQSPHSREHLILYADGPCMDSVLSRAEVIVQFLECSCPTGFQPSGGTNTSCVCVCDPVLADYVKECDPSNGLLHRENTNSWISHTDQLGYIIHPHCPFDYCFPSTTRLSINLNLQNGSDAQCNFNRSGVLCGACTPGYSLSMGTSECINCQGSRWYGGFIGLVLIVVIGGIVLVSLILFLNITVAVGTINGIIFYANVIAANNSAFLRFVDHSFPSVFIAWMNLDIGFNICAFDGNNAYTKTWLELIFPTYMFIIIVVIIVVSKYSQRFSNFVGMKNPVATLATLILLSYTKLLRLTITMLSSTNIKYTNSSYQTTVWRPDGNVLYLQDRHVALFLAALLILLVGVLFTMALLCWQCLLRISNKKLIRHVINTKVQSFMETYCVPFHAEHRYWTGMLLLVRVILYFIAGVEQSGNPQVQLVATTILVGFILLIKVLVRRTIYEKYLVDVLENLLLFNILALSAFVLYAGDSRAAAIAAAYLSTITTFLLLLVIIGYHIIWYTPLYQFAAKMGIERFINEKHDMPVNRPYHPEAYGIPRDIDIFELMDQPHTEDYRSRPEIPHLTPVVINIPKPKIQPSTVTHEDGGAEKNSESHVAVEVQGVRSSHSDVQGVMSIKEYSENQQEYYPVIINQMADDVVIPSAITDEKNSY